MARAEKMNVIRGDITTLDVDAIVNAANTTLLGGGGVDGAIHRSAGPDLLAECLTLGGCHAGEAKLTRGYNLPARFVIHAVGPIWRGGDRGEAEVLANCYRNSLQLALDNGIKTIAFPAISCGAYRYPISEAAQIAVETSRGFLRKNNDIENVIFVVAADEIFSAYQRLLKKANRGLR
jgi:O-acetyl-ADP-ribose deacetylase (regulator of RNase III)